MPPGPPLLCRSVCRESKKSPMARSWRNFFRKSTDEEQENGPAVASEPEPAAEDVEEGNGHHPVELAPADEVLAENVPTAEEAQAEPTPVEAESDAEAVAEAQESVGWFGRLRQGLSRSRASFVGQLNAAVAEFRDVGDEEFWERVEEI